MIKIYALYYNHPEVLQWLRNCNYYYFNDGEIGSTAHYEGWNQFSNYFIDLIGYELYTSDEFETIIEAWDEADNPR